MHQKSEIEKVIFYSSNAFAKCTLVSTSFIPLSFNSFEEVWKTDVPVQKTNLVLDPGVVN